MCEFAYLMNHIADTCLCVPEYVPYVRNVVGNQSLKACNFYEHSTCVSYIRSYFDPIVAKCLPACLNSEYKRNIIQVNTIRGPNAKI